MEATLMGQSATTILRWTIQVNREDLLRNGITKPPEEWESNDLAIADRLGLIYAWEVEVEDV
jgi:hypothetical protein